MDFWFYACVLRQHGLPRLNMLDVLASALIFVDAGEARCMLWSDFLAERRFLPLHLDDGLLRHAFQRLHHKVEGSPQRPQHSRDGVVLRDVQAVESRCAS